MPANALAARQECYTCHRDGKVSDVLHLSRKTTFQTSKCPESTMPAKKNEHNSKNGHCVRVKLHLDPRKKVPETLAKHRF
jgi:hypothetical protein